MYVFTVVRAAGTDLDAVHVEGVTVVHLGARPGEEAEHPDGEPGGAYHQGTQRRHGRPALDLPRHERQRPPAEPAVQIERRLHHVPQQHLKVTDNFDLIDFTSHQHLGFSTGQHFNTFSSVSNDDM